MPHLLYSTHIGVGVFVGLEGFEPPLGGVKRVKLENL